MIKPFKVHIDFLPIPLSLIERIYYTFIAMHQNSAVLHNTSQNWYIGWHVGGFKARGDRSGGLSCPCANHTTSTEDIPPAPTSAPTHERALNTKELAKLRQFMAPLETPTDTSSSFAHSGNLATALDAWWSLGNWLGNYKSYDW